MKLLCPSAPADAPDARVFGVVKGHSNGRQVAYLTESIPLDAKVAALAEPASPNEVMRVSAECRGTECCHFGEGKCTLVSRITEQLSAVVDRPPPCSIRKTCRWWHQEGVRACLRCPQIITASRDGSAGMQKVIEPPARLNGP